MMMTSLRKRWCSWCLRKTTHVLVESNTLRRNVYRCQGSGCGQKTLECRYCTEMTRGGDKWDDECCAVHDGTIADFERLSLKLDDLTEWREITKRTKWNMSRTGKIAAGVGVVALVGTGVGLAAAPAIGGAIGSAGASLSGAAATSSGLATLGGGSIAAGGLGVAGGTAVVSLGFGALGGVGGGLLVNKYAGDIQGFDIKARNEGKGPEVIVINGFLSSDGPQMKDWRPALRANFLEHPWRVVRWETRRNRDLGKMVAKGAGSAALRGALKEAAKRATKEAGKKLNPASWLMTALGIAGNDWHVAVRKAQMTGDLLADLILRTDGRKRYVLVGHSLGARVIYFTMRALARHGTTRPRIKEVHLLGGATDSSKKAWNGLEDTVSGRIYNYYSKNDLILKHLYQTAQLFNNTPIGRQPIRHASPKIVNVDVTDMVDGHSAYKASFKEFIRRD
jgi:pimeloyl-ACP methyl ester carboxylesterase